MALPGNYKYICLLGKKESNKKRKEKVLHAKYLKPLRAKGGGVFGVWKSCA